MDTDKEQSTEYMDPDIEFLLEENEELKRREAERKAARNAKNARKQAHLAPGELSPQDQGIRAKKANAQAQESRPATPPAISQFIIPPAINATWTVKQQKLYIDAGFQVFPVKPWTSAYFVDRIPGRDPGLTETDCKNWTQVRGVTKFRAIIPEDIVVIDLDRKNGKDGVQVFNDWLTQQGIRTGALADVESGSHPFTTLTAGGGFHLYYQAPKFLKGIKTETGIMRGVDVLMPGGAVATAGSRREDGTAYFPNFITLMDLPKLPYEIAMFIFNAKSTEDAKKYNARVEADEFADEDEEWEQRRIEGMTPKMILGWRLKAWDDGKKDYSGHNDFFMKAVAECKNKEMDPEEIWDAIIRCEYFRDWEDQDKADQIARMLNSMCGYNPLKTYKFGGCYGY